MNFCFRKITKEYFTIQKSSAQTTHELQRTTYQPIVPPQILSHEAPVSPASAATIAQARDECIQVITGQDDRLIVVVGPCSIHHPIAALDYAQQLKKLRLQYSGELVIIMRAYCEKPRTTVGWKGLINDPDLNDTFELNKGLKIARKLLVDLNEMGMPVACEVLSPLCIQYLGELISWGAIGARTTESQIHRELASGLDFPIGFKNGTDGGCKVAIDAIQAAAHPHHYIGITPEAIAAISVTRGNKNCHAILRGGSQGPNYDAGHIQGVTKQLENAGLSAKIMVDCSHGNSGKAHRNQILVSQNLASQLANGNNAIIGVMIESNIEEGRQDISPAGVDGLKYGVSITDACISMPQTAIILGQLAQAVLARRQHKNHL